MIEIMSGLFRGHGLSPLAIAMALSSFTLGVVFASIIETSRSFYTALLWSVMSALALPASIAIMIIAIHSTID